MNQVKEICKKRREEEKDGVFLPEASRLLLLCLYFWCSVYLGCEKAEELAADTLAVCPQHDPEGKLNPVTVSLQPETITQN